MSRKHVNKGLAPKKGDLPHKDCVVCNRPFAWRAKWARDWDSITTCSDRCRSQRRRETGPGGSTSEPSA